MIPAPFLFQKSNVGFRAKVYEIWAHTVKRGHVSGHCYRYQGLIALETGCPAVMVAEHPLIPEKMIVTTLKRWITARAGELIWWKW